MDKLTDFIVSIIPGVIGSVISLRFMPVDPEAPPRKRIWTGCTGFIIGVVLSYYAGGGIIEYYKLAGLMAEAIRFALGLFGLVLVTNLVREIPLFFRGLRRKFTGKEF